MRQFVSVLFVYTPAAVSVLVLNCQLRNCLRVPLVIEGWDGGEFPPTYRRSQLCNGIQQKPRSFVAFVIFRCYFETQWQV